MNSLLDRPRLLGLVCAVAAVGLGLFYLSAAGAPAAYSFVNLAALVLGLTSWLALGPAASSRLDGPACLLLAGALLLTALFGMEVEGAARWVRLGPLNLQASLILLPPMLLLYARRADPIGTAAMVVAAAALAAQPDRAMAGALLAGLIGTTAARPGAWPATATAAAALAFGWTLFVPDALPAVPYVDRVFAGAFALHPLAGTAVATGAAALLVPALAGLMRGAGDRAALLAFGGCWAAIVAAAALGNYPTPLVGYGGSVVLGYLLSAALLPRRLGEPARRAAPAAPKRAAGAAPPPASDLCPARPG